MSEQERKNLPKGVQKVETSGLDIEKMATEELEAMYRDYDQKIRREELDGLPEDERKRVNATKEQARQQLDKIVDRKRGELERNKRIDEIIQKIKDKYHITETPPQLDGQLYAATLVFGGLENLKDKKILDLGCGSSLDESTQKLLERYVAGDSWADQEIIRRGMYDLAMNAQSALDNLKSRLYEPWFCRALLELGAQPIGVDIGSLEGEEFEHYRTDLSKLGSLDFLPDQSFDGINLRQVLSSPQLERMERQMTHGDIKKN